MTVHHYEFDDRKVETLEDAGPLVTPPFIAMKFGVGEQPKPCARVGLMTVSAALLPDNPRTPGFVAVAFSSADSKIGGFVALASAEARRIAAAILEACDDVENASAHG